MIRNCIVLGLGFAAAAAATMGSLAGAANQGKMVKASSYARVEGIIKTSCVSCHNATRHPEGVDLSSYAALMKCGVAVPGHPEKSRLITYVDGTKQPRMPMGKPPLSAAQIASLKAWVKAGAKA